MLTCGSNRNRSTPSNLTPSTDASAVRSSIVSRSMGGSPSGPLPTSPGHIALCRAGNLCCDTPFMETSALPLARRAQRLGVRIAWAKMLENHQGISVARVLDADTRLRRFVGHEELILRHLSESDHRRRRDAVTAERAVALRQDQAVGGRLA